MSCLVIAEHDESQVHPGALELITAAREVGEVAVALIGRPAPQVLDAVDVPGVAEVVTVDATIDGLDPDGHRRVVSELIRFRKPTVTLLASTPQTMAYGPAVAVTNGLGFASDVHALRLDGDSVHVIRSFCGGKVDAELDFPGREGVLLVLRPATWALASGPTGSARRTAVSIDAPATRTQRRGLIDETASAVDLTKANLILAVGRGIGEYENLALFEALAEKIGATLAASRPPVDSGWVSADRLVGQSGKIVKPRVYLAFGISGAPQHLAGVGSSTTIVAVNHDAKAAIFRVADYGGVFDAVAFARELETLF